MNHVGRPEFLAVSTAFCARQGARGRHLQEPQTMPPLPSYVPDTVLCRNAPGIEIHLVYFYFGPSNSPVARTAEPPSTMQTTLFCRNEAFYKANAIALNTRMSLWCEGQGVKSLVPSRGISTKYHLPGH